MDNETHRNTGVSIRTATPDDATAIAEIYRPYVLDTAITFELEPPSADEFRRRMAHTLQRYPYLVATDDDGRIVGYAYASPLNTRAAYDWSAEVTVYVDARHRHQGVGTALYAALEQRLAHQHVTNLYACITFSETEDRQHDNSSMRYHEAGGYALTAHFHRCGFKFDRWWDVIWMEKIIGPHLTPQPPFIPFAECTE